MDHLGWIHDRQVFQQGKPGDYVQELLLRGVGVPQVKMSQSVGEHAKISVETRDEKVSVEGNESETIQLGD